MELIFYEWKVSMEYIVLAQVLIILNLNGGRNKF